VISLSAVFLMARRLIATLSLALLGSLPACIGPIGERTCAFGTRDHPVPAGCTMEVTEADGQNSSRVGIVEPGANVHVHLPGGKNYGRLAGGTSTYDFHPILKQLALSGDGLDGTYQAISPGQGSLYVFSTRPPSSKSAPAWSIRICVAGLEPTPGKKDHSQTDISLANNCALGQFGMSRVGRTTDGGQIWTDVTPAVTADPVFGPKWELFAKKSQAWLLQVPSATATRTVPVFVSADIGRTWSPRSPVTVPPGLTYSLVTSTDSRHAWLLFNHGTPSFPQLQPTGVAITTDSGITWTLAPMPSQPCDPRDLVFVDPLNGWATGACAERPMFMATHDAGQTWSWVQLPVPADEPSPLAKLPCNCSAAGLAFSDPMHGSFDLNRSLIPTESPTNERWIYTSADGGRTWQVTRKTP